MDTIFDGNLVEQRKLRAARRAVAGADFLLVQAADELTLRLSAVERQFATAATIHCLGMAAAQALRASGKVDTLCRVEANAELLAARSAHPSIVSPREELPLADASLDLAVSLLALHETNDTPGIFAQIRRALRPDGLFLAAIPGQGTLAELRTSLLSAEAEMTGGASPRVFPFMEVRDAGGLLQRAGFALPVADTETLTVRYDTMFHLMRDLRAMGATNTLVARSRVPTRREVFARAAEIYAERFSDPDGRIRATFSIIWLSGWAPHASQQKPLKPGSGKVSLASILGGQEPEKRS